MLESTIKPSVIQPYNLYKNTQIISEYAGVNHINPRTNFLTALNTLQRYRLKFHTAKDEIMLNFGDSKPHTKEMFAHVMTVQQLPKNWMFSNYEQKSIKEHINRGLQLLKNFDEQIWYAIHFVIGQFIFARREKLGGGSISSTIGTVWLNPSNNWNALDFADRILHEYVHQCIFIHEMVNSIFTSNTIEELAENEARVTSTILGHNRGYAKSFHSAFVAFTLMQFYLKLGIRCYVEKFSIRLETTLLELNSKRHLLTTSGQNILDDLRTAFAEFKHKYV